MNIPLTLKSTSTRLAPPTQWGCGGDRGARNGCIEDYPIYFGMHSAAACPPAQTDTDNAGRSHSTTWPARSRGPVEQLEKLDVCGAEDSYK